MLSKLRPQAIALNVAVVFLLVSLVVTPTWHCVVAVLGTLGALCFRWTREVGPQTDNKRLDKLDESFKELKHRLGNIAFKVGLKGE